MEADKQAPIKEMHAFACVIYESGHHCHSLPVVRVTTAIRWQDKPWLDDSTDNQQEQTDSKSDSRTDDYAQRRSQDVYNQRQMLRRC